MQQQEHSVLLINSPLFREPTEATDEDYLPSLGLGTLAKVAKQNGIRVEYVDAIFEKQGVAQLLALIENGSWNAVALNIFTVNAHLVREIVERASRTTHFIIGGLSTKSLLPTIESWRSESPISVVFGDGENIFPLLVRNRDEVASTSDRGSVRFYEVSASSPYYSRDISGIHADRSIFKYEPYRNIHGLLEICLVTSRGCIYNCAFCAAARSRSRELTVREASVESIRAELSENLRRRPDLQSVRILDDLYLKNRGSIQRATETFSTYQLCWRAMAHVASIKQVNDADLGALHDSGCTELFVGIESGSPEVLKRIHKTSDVELIHEQISRLLSAGISAKCYFIFGFPEETQKDMAMTLNLATRLQNSAKTSRGNFRTSVFQFRPYHGTELYHAVQKNGGTIVERDARYDRELTARVGRAQFNFEAGNFSAVPTETLRDFIAQAAALRTQH
jgi:radical SAM superfamily enzyme YgiQ (UPF0313 family)